MRDYFNELVEVPYGELVDILEGYAFRELYTGNNLEAFWDIINYLLYAKPCKHFADVSRQTKHNKLVKLFPAFKKFKKIKYKNKLLILLGLVQCKKCGKFFRAEKYMVIRDFICFDCIEEFKEVPDYIRKELKLKNLKRCTVCKEYKDMGTEFYPINTGCKIDYICKDCRKKKNLKYNKEHPEKMKANAVKYRASKLKRTPKWAELEEIEEFYKNCPEGYHVDHIIPLQGKNVSGFHCLSNLQYLTPEENIRKSNKYEPKILIKGVDY